MGSQGGKIDSCPRVCFREALNTIAPPRNTTIPDWDFDTVAGPMPNLTGTSDATVTGPRSTVPSVSNVSVINSFNIVAAENPNIAQVAHDCIWEKSIAQDVVVAPDIPALQWYWIDSFGDKLYPGARPFERFACLQIFYQVFPRD